MTAITGTLQTYAQVGRREDLADIISNISPTDTPFYSMCKKVKASNTYFEWQTESLTAAGANAQIEGDDITSFTAAVQPTRIGNRTQILRKDLIISGTSEASSLAGRKSEIARQIMIRGKELKRDIEYAFTQNTTAVTGDATTARQTRGLEGWVATNNSLSTGTVAGVAPNPSTNTAPTDGTQRAFTETLLKDVLQKCYSSGGNPDTIMVGPTQKQTFSTFAGNSTRFKKAEDAELMASVDVYVSDFGTLKVVPNRFQRARTAFVLQSDMWQSAVLRDFAVENLAKTGDAEKRMLIVELGLRAENEAASGAVRDLT